MAAGSCPSSAFPGTTAHTRSGPGLSPVQNGDLVLHPVLGTLLGLLLGMGPAGQVYRNRTHTHTPQVPTASASCSWPLLTSHPHFSRQSRASPHFHPPSSQLDWKIGMPQEVFTCPFNLLAMRTTSCQSGKSLTTQSSARLRPLCQMPQSNTQDPCGLCREAALSIWTMRTKDSEVSAVSLPRVTTAGCSHCHQRL